MKRHWAVALLSAAALNGQASITGPTGQFVFDPGTKTIRAIIGSPGSAYLGNSVTAALQFGSVAPRGVSGILVTDGASHLVADLRQPSPPVVQLAGAIANPDQILWSQDSTAAVLFSSVQRSLQFVSLIGGQPVVSARSDLSALEPPQSASGSGMRGTHGAAGLTSLLAIDPTAKFAVVAIGGSAGSSVYLMQDGVAPRLLTSLASSNAAAFGPDGSLYIVDAASGHLWVVGNPSTNANITSVPFPQGGLARPVAIAVDGNLIYIASSADNQIRVYEPTTFQQVDQLNLDSAPSTLLPFTGTSFMVNARRNPTDPLLLLQTSPSRSVIFIPSGANQ